MTHAQPTFGLTTAPHSSTFTAWIPAIRQRWWVAADGPATLEEFASWVKAQLVAKLEQNDPPGVPAIRYQAEFTYGAAWGEEGVSGIAIKKPS